MNLSLYLDDLERRIKPKEEDSLVSQWLSFADGNLSEGFFAPSRSISPPLIVWPEVNINDCIYDLDLMIYQQLKELSEILAGGGGGLLSVRPNYGTGIIPSMYGAEVFIMPYEANTLPCTKPLPGAKTAVKRILENDPNIIKPRGLVSHVFNFVERWAEVSARYEFIRHYVHLYNPDLQGPFPLADMLWGSDIYTDIIDEPETVNAAIAFFAAVIITLLKKYQTLCPPFDGSHSVEWGLLHRGGVIIRNDAVMNISGNMYKEFVQPHDKRIIDTFGGGIHFCGKGDHYIAHVSQIKGLSTFNMSQPEYNDMEIIYQNTIDKGIIIIGMPAYEVKRAVEAGRNLRGRVHCGASLAAWLDKENTSD